MKWLHHEKKGIFLNLKHAKKITYYKSDDSFHIRITEDPKNDHTIVCKDEESGGMLTKKLMSFLSSNEPLLIIEEKYCK